LNPATSGLAAQPSLCARALDLVNLMILRPGAFFEGSYAVLETIRHERVVADSVAPEGKVPMIATADIAAVARRGAARAELERRRGPRAARPA